jgi:hypothetical protein
MIKNNLREFDQMNTYWYVDTVDKFENIEVHGIMGDIKYLCCLSCQSEIVGYWEISDPSQIYIACQRVQLEV